MTVFNIKVADTSFRISCLFSSTMDFCKDYLINEYGKYCVSIDSSDIEFEREKDKRERAYEGLPVVEWSDSYLETLALYRKMVQILIDHDILLFHGSAVMVEGCCFIFTAKSGMGKSTHVEKYERLFGGVVINDDKPLLKVKNNSIICYGTPWAGKHNKQTNVSCKVKAICILEQSENNSIEKLPFSNAFSVLLQQVYRFKEKDCMAKTLRLLNKFNTISIYKLKCNMDDSAAILSYERMK